METISLQELKYRIFVDTNILIDCFVTPVPETIQYLQAIQTVKDIELVTSDYALWEQNEFIRKQVWLKHLVNSNLSHKGALTYRMKLTDDISDDVKSGIDNCMNEHTNYNIFNYNLMDDEVQNKDFFRLLELLTSYSTISNQDLLILLSAYVTASKAILSKDGRFTSEFRNIASLEETIKTSNIPRTLKKIKFLVTSKEPKLLYADWLKEEFANKVIGRCINVYDKVSVVSLECDGENEIAVNDYLLLLKITNDNNIEKEVIKVADGNLQDYDSETAVQSAKKVTIKVENVDMTGRGIFKGANVYKIEPD